MKAATLGLPVDPAIGHAWIVGYFNKKAKKKLAEFQIGYKGYVQLGHRTREYAIIHPGEIYEGQEIHRNQLTGQIILNGTQTGSKIIAFFVYVKLNSGYEDFEIMTTEEIIDHARHYSPSWEMPGSAWKDEREFPKMAKKTVIRRLFNSGRVPISVDLRQALKDDESVNVNGTPLGDMFGGYEDETITTTATDAPEPVAPEPTPEEDKTGEIIAWMVSENHAPSIETATAMLKLFNGDPKDEPALYAFCKVVNAWIDKTGCTLTQAAKYTNKGESPK
jgi:recombination protein RecT